MITFELIIVFTFVKIRNRDFVPILLLWLIFLASY